MAGLDDLYQPDPRSSRSPSKLGVDESEVEQRHPDAGAGARRWSAGTTPTGPRAPPTASPRLPTSTPPAACSTAASASTRSTSTTAPSAVAKIFGGNDTGQVASALSGRRRRQQRPDPEAAADPGADRARLHRQAAHRAVPQAAQPAAAGAVRRRRPRRRPGQHPRRRARRRRQQPARQHPGQRARRRQGRRRSATSSAGCWAARSSGPASASDS